MHHLKLRTLSFLLPIIWGSTFMLIKVAERDFSPSNISILRFGIAGGVFVALFATGRIRFRRIGRRDLPAFSGMVVTLLVGQLLLNHVLVRVPAFLVSVVVQTAPAMALLLSLLSGAEPFRRRTLLGMGLAFTGTFVILLGGSDHVPSLSATQPLLLSLFVPFSIATYNFLAKPLAERYGAANIAGQAVGFTGAILMTMAPLRPSLYREASVAPGSAWACVIGLAVVATVASYLLWGILLERLSRSEVASLVYLVPAVSAVLSVTMLREPLRPAVVLGALGVVVGLRLIGQRAGHGDSPCSFSARSEIPAVSAYISRPQSTLKEGNDGSTARGEMRACDGRIRGDRQIRRDSACR